jgi:tetratricopeptide (TPR) repeat protein
LSKLFYKLILALLFIFVFINGSLADAPAGSNTNFVFSLLQDKKFNEAAIEARRMALSTTNNIEKAAYLFLAAYAYSATQDFERAIKMLDAAEDTYPQVKENALFLRGKVAMEQGRYDEALFYFDALLPAATSKAMNQFILQEMAVSHFMQGNTNSALASIREFDGRRREETAAALQDFYSKPDKSPRIGGVLGLIPGLGYAYSEEYANALRCFLLNGIFISALAYCASEEQWGAFAVVSFFELTWYSGSIYGGVDAAHRYNRTRRAKVSATLRAGAGFDGIDFSTFPKISLQFRF